MTWDRPGESWRGLLRFILVQEYMYLTQVGVQPYYFSMPSVDISVLLILAPLLTVVTEL